MGEQPTWAVGWSAAHGLLDGRVQKAERIVTGHHVVALHRSMIEVPEAWRESLEYGAVVTVSHGGAVVETWPTLEFCKREAATSDQPWVDERQAELLRRFVAARSVETTLDEHGRLEIPRFMLNDLGLPATSAVRMVSTDTHIECHQTPAIRDDSTSWGT